MLDMLAIPLLLLFLLFNVSALVWGFFMVQDEETGAWYQHRARDFKVPLVGYLQEDGNVVGAKKGLGIFPGC